MNVCVFICVTVQTPCLGQICLVWTKGQETRWLLLRHRAAVVWDSANEWTSLYASPWCCSSLNRSQGMFHRGNLCSTLFEKCTGKCCWLIEKFTSPECSTQASTADLYLVFPQIGPRHLCTVKNYLSLQKKVLHLWLISS